MSDLLEGYWNGEVAKYKRVLVEVGKSPRDTWWCAGLEGKEIEAVEVHYSGEVFYLADDDMSGTYKVTKGMGSPQVGHKGLPVAKVIRDL